MLEAEYGNLQAASAECLLTDRDMLWYIERSALYNLAGWDFPLIQETKGLRSSASHKMGSKLVFKLHLHRKEVFLVGPIVYL